MTDTFDNELLCSGVCEETDNCSRCRTGLFRDMTLVHHQQSFAAGVVYERARIEEAVRNLLWTPAHQPSLFGPVGEPLVRRESVLKVITDTMPAVPSD